MLFFTLFSLDDQGVDYEEEDFTRRMKRATAKRRKNEKQILGVASELT